MLFSYLEHRVCTIVMSLSYLGHHFSSLMTRHRIFYKSNVTDVNCGT